MLISVSVFGVSLLSFLPVVFWQFIVSCVFNLFPLSLCPWLLSAASCFPGVSIPLISPHYLIVFRASVSFCSLSVFLPFECKQLLFWRLGHSECSYSLILFFVNWPNKKLGSSLFTPVLESCVLQRNVIYKVCVFDNLGKFTQSASAAFIYFADINLQSFTCTALMWLTAQRKLFFLSVRSWYSALHRLALLGMRQWVWTSFGEQQHSDWQRLSNHDWLVLRSLKGATTSFSTP